MRVEYHPQSVTDLNEAVVHYNGLRAGLGDALRAEVYATVSRICFNPEQHRRVEEELRRCFVHRFPYSVLFRRVGEDAVRVLVIRHHRRHPQFGLSRQ